MMLLCVIVTVTVTANAAVMYQQEPMVPMMMSHHQMVWADDVRPHWMCVSVGQVFCQCETIVARPDINVHRLSLASHYPLDRYRPSNCRVYPTFGQVGVAVPVYVIWKRYVTNPLQTSKQTFYKWHDWLELNAMRFRYFWGALNVCYSNSCTTGSYLFILSTTQLIDNDSIQKWNAVNFRRTDSVVPLPC